MKKQFPTKQLLRALIAVAALCGGQASAGTYRDCKGPERTITERDNYVCVYIDEHPGVEKRARFASGFSPTSHFRC